MIRLSTLAISAVLVVSAPAAWAQDASAALFRATTVTLDATGQVKAAPDQATVSLGVQTQARTAAAALAENRTRMNAAMAALSAQGVGARDIQTSALNLQAQYDYQQGQAQRLTGYQADNQVTIVVHDLARLGAVVDAVTASGANQLSGIAFSLSDPTVQEDVARREAVRRLRARAELYAQATGLKVARLVNLSETSNAPPILRPMMMRAMAGAEKIAPTPVEPGELTVQVQLSAMYELTP